MFVGSHQMQIRDEAKDVSFSVLVLYPTEVPSLPVAFGPYTFDVSPDAPLAMGTFALVVVSHGSGGSHLLYRTIATHLAKHGYIVAMLEHAGNNRNDNSLDGTHQNLVNRPRHVRLTIDAVIQSAQFRGCVQADNTAIIGHSMGGYTALAVAGGEPWSEDGKKVAVEADSRIRALVLLAPAAAWYLPQGALRAVVVPILMLIAERDLITPRWHADLVHSGVGNPTQVTCRVVDNAGHFSFLSPFPPHLRSSNFAPSIDPQGFDREAFHQRLPAELLTYLDAHLMRSE